MERLWREASLVIDAMTSGARQSNDESSPRAMQRALDRRSVPSRRRARLLRTGSACLPLALIASLALPRAAAAAPATTLVVKAIPIPGFPGTGDFLGAGTDVEAQVTISGSEYGGFPSPLTGINVYAPLGARVTSTGFATCAPSVLAASGAEGCPKRSSAGAQGVGFGVVSFGGERVPEEVSIRQFFAPGGGLTFYVVGSTPASFEIVENAHWVTASAPYGKELIVEVPLIETVPGANDASVTSFKVKIGAAYKKGKRTVSYLTQPKKCPPGGFPVKMELKFLSGETDTVSQHVPCPSGIR